jgi:hypothetical protein
MANIPGMSGVLPGVFGPTGTEISKSDKGYAINWSGGLVWGKPHVEGSPKEIARDLIVRYSAVLALPQESWSTPMDAICWYGAISVKWKPELTVSLNKTLYILEGVDAQLFVDEMTAELKSLVKLLPFV